MWELMAGWSLRGLAVRTPARGPGSRQPRSRLAPLGKRCDAKSAAARATPLRRERLDLGHLPVITGMNHGHISISGLFLVQSARAVHIVRSPPYSDVADRARGGRWRMKLAANSTGPRRRGPPLQAAASCDRRDRPGGGDTPAT